MSSCFSLEGSSSFRGADAGVNAFLRLRELLAFPRVFLVCLQPQDCSKALPALPTAFILRLCSPRGQGLWLLCREGSYPDL